MPNERKKPAEVRSDIKFLDLKNQTATFCLHTYNTQILRDVSSKQCSSGQACISDENKSIYFFFFQERFHFIFPLGKQWSTLCFHFGNDT